MEEITGAKLGNYTLTQHLARGGMSDIYLARREDSNQICVLKLVEQQDEECYLRFQREVRELSQLQHEHILSILDHGEQDGVSYYAAPYIQHGTLKTAIAAGPLSVEEAGEILVQVGDALQFIHDAGRVHRDIKSTNILLDESGWAWLADFGLTKEVTEGSDVTRTGCLIGTPSYMAPELVEQSASVSSDIYALGVVLYEMLTGRPPFIGRTPLEICWKHASTPPPLPSTFNAQIPPAIESVMLHALEKDPQARFASVKEMVDAYQEALDCRDSFSDPEEIWLQEAGMATAITVKRVRASRFARGRALQGRSLLVAMIVVMLATLFALGSLGLAIEIQSHPSAPVSSGAQMITLPNQATPTSASSATPSLIISAAGARAVQRTPTPVPQRSPRPPKPPKHGHGDK